MKQWIKNRLARILFVTLGALLGMQTAHGSAVTILKDEMTYTINPDMTYTYEEHEDVLINDPTGVKNRGEKFLSFNESDQSIEILEAYTTTQAGERIDVPSENIVVRQPSVSLTYPKFSNIKYKAVIFPRASVGAVLTIGFKRTQLRPRSPGVFSMMEIFSTATEFKNATLRIRAPKGMQLNIDTRDVQGGELKRGDDQSREWLWTIANTDVIPVESGSVNLSDVSPFVMATTINSYDDLARIYRSGAGHAAEVTDLIRKQADEITAGISDKRHQAEAIYEWVVKNIRYIALENSQSSTITPHDANSIIQTGYGDDKDFATILNALYAAKGIRSTLALVNSNQRYNLEKFPSLYSFNHVINFLPDYNLFVDSSVNVASFGILSTILRGKATLITDTGDGKSLLTTVPFANSKDDVLTASTKINIDVDGTVHGQDEFKVTGRFDLAGREFFVNIQKDNTEQWMSAALSKMAQNGTGHLEFGDTQDLGVPFTYKAFYTIPQKIPVLGLRAKSFDALYGIDAAIGLRQFAAQTATATRHLPFPCYGGRWNESTQMIFPGNIHLIDRELPRPVKISSKFGIYESKYSLVGKELTVTRSLEMNFNKAVCDSDDYIELRSMNERIKKDYPVHLVYY